jgi:methionyl-tRNA formyltransferase
MPDDAAGDDLARQVGAARPDAIFSFYYRHMLPASLLALAARGAYNMHGSLLPKYRGRVPVNWAILNGESETGATLHEMVARPDAGAIIGQTAVPILPDDIAREVFAKVTVAAEQTLWRCLPGLIYGSAPRLANDLARGSYFGGRKPEDGRIDWSREATDVYNLVRAVAPPYPGAFCDVGGTRLIIAAARLSREGPSGALDLEPGLKVRDNRVFGVCGDGRALLILRLEASGREVSPAALEVLLKSP